MRRMRSQRYVAIMTSREGRFGTILAEFFCSLRCMETFLQLSAIRSWFDEARGAIRQCLRSITIKPTDGHSSIERKVMAGFGVAIAFLIIIAGFAYRSAQTYVETNRWVAHTYQVLGMLTKISSRLNEAESQQRAYLITADNWYLQWPDGAFSEIGKDIGALKELTPDNHFNGSAYP